MEEVQENQLQSLIQGSGNSNVDVSIDIDIETKSIAYAMLCSMYAKQELTELELQRAVDKLDKLIDRDRENRDNQRQSHNIQMDTRDTGSVRKFFEFPVSERRRNWL